MELNQLLVLGQPAALWGLLGLPLLLACHLLSRRAGLVGWFPATRLIIAIEQAQQQRSRLNNILLLIVRLLLLTMLILGFGQLESYLPIKSAPDAPPRWLMIIDASASMQRSADGKRLFEHAVAKTRQWINNAPTGTPIMVFLANDKLQPLAERPNTSKDFWQQRLNHIRCSWQYTDFNIIVRQLDSWQENLVNLSYSDHLMLITDAQASGNIQPAVTDWHDRFDDHFQLLILGRNLPTNNLAWTDPQTDNTHITSTAGRASAQVTNTNDQQATLTVALQTADRRQIQQITVPPHDKRIVQTEGTANRPGMQTVSFNLPRDAYEFDNQLTVLIPTRSKQTVTILTDAPATEPTVQLIAAAVAPDDRAPYRVTIQSPDAPLPITDNQALLIHRWQQVNPDRIKSIQRAAQRRTPVLIVAQTPADICLPAMLTKTARPDIQVHHFKTPAGWQITHAQHWPWQIFQGAAFDVLTRPMAKSCFHLQPPTGWTIDAIYPNQLPAVAHDRNMALINAPIQPDFGLANTPVLLPLIYQLLNPPTTTSTRLIHTAAPGQPVNLTLPNHIDPATLSLLGPNDAPVSMTITQQAGQTTAQLNCRTPGPIKLIDPDGRIIAGYTVMIPAAESQLAPADLTFARQADSDQAALTYANSPAIPLWPACLILAICLLVAESWLANRGGSRS